MDLEILKEILIVFDHLCDVQGMQVWEQDSNNLAQAAFGRQRSEEDLRWGWGYDALHHGRWVWDSFEDPRKGPHLPSFPTLLRLGGLFGVLWLFFPLNMTMVEIFFGRDEDIWHCLCGIVAAFWRFGIWTKKLLELISSYFHNGNNKDLIKSQNKCHSIHHNIYWTKVYFQKIQASGIFYQSLGESVLPENIDLAPRKNYLRKVFCQKI